MLARGGVRLAVVVAIAFALAPGAIAGAQSSYRVIEIGTVPGFTTIGGDDINASGQVVGTLQGRPYLEEWSAFVWDPASGLRVLGQFAGEGTFGMGINDHGVVAGVAQGGSVYFPGTAFRWTAAGGFESLGSGGTPTDINNDGEVVGYSLGPAWVRWGANGQVQPFEQTIYGSPKAINDSGQIVGDAPGIGPAYIFDPQTGLGELPQFPGGLRASAYDINELGHVTGVSDVPYTTKRKDTTPCGLRATSCAVIWRDGRPTVVGPDFSFGYGINNSDHVVGQFLKRTSTGSSTYHAFLYRNGVFSDLNQLVPAGTPLLEEAKDTNDAGWILANSQGRAFVLIPR
jgi:probable HAF family extracellular repeat protein